MTETKDQPMTAQELSSAVGSRIKNAGQRAAKQAERTKIANISLPAAYRALGKHLYGQKLFRDEFPDQYKQFDQLAAELKALKDQAAARPTAEGIAAKAKGAALGAKDLAQTKAIEVKINYAFSKFGDAAFAKFGDKVGAADHASRIAGLQTQLRQLDSELAVLSDQKFEKLRLTNPLPYVKQKLKRLMTPKRLAIAGGIFVLLIVVSIFLHAQSAKLMAEADQLWNTGDRAGAVEKYTKEVNDNLAMMDTSEKSRAFGRIIDFQVKTNGPEAAKDYIHQAVQSEIPLSLTNADANKLLATERERAAQEAKAVQESKTAQVDKGVGTQTAAGEGGVTWDSVSGMTTGELTQKFGQPEAFYPSPANHPNIRSLAWKVGDDKYVSVLVLGNLQGGPDAVQAVTRILSHAEIEALNVKLKGVTDRGDGN